MGQDGTMGYLAGLLPFGVSSSVMARTITSTMTPKEEQTLSACHPCRLSKWLIAYICEVMVSPMRISPVLCMYGAWPTWRMMGVRIPGRRGRSGGHYPLENDTMEDGIGRSSCLWPWRLQTHASPICRAHVDVWPPFVQPNQVLNERGGR